MKRITRSDIVKLSLENPTIHACLQAYRHPESGLIFEDALAAMVDALHAETVALKARLVESAKTAPANDDTARLNWMQTNLCKMATVTLPDGREIPAHAWSIAAARPNLREAVDTVRFMSGHTDKTDWGEN